MSILTSGTAPSALLLFFVLINPNHVSAQPQPDTNSKSLLSRYDSGSIYLTPIALRDIRSFLRDPTRKEMLDVMPEPIPKGVAVLRSYIDSIYPDLMHPERGVSFLQIDFVNGKAYDQRAVDPIGSPRKVNWIAAEVMGAAVLSDVFIRTNRTKVVLMERLGGGATQVTASWSEFKALSSSPYLSSDSAAQYIDAIVKVIVADSARADEIRTVDLRSYSEIKTLATNYNGIKALSFVPSVSPSLIDTSVWAKASKDIKLGVVEDAKVWAAFDILDASKRLRTMTASERKNTVLEKLDETPQIYPLNPWIATKSKDILRIQKTMDSAR